MVLLLQAIESLRGLLGECRSYDHDDDVKAPPQRPGVTAPAAGKGDAGHIPDGVDTPSRAVAAEGELARVARGRLEWLTKRLRGHLSSELAAALRQADPLAAGRGGGGGDGESGAGLSEADRERRREAVARVEVRGGCEER